MFLIIAESGWLKMNDHYYLILKTDLVLDVGLIASLSSSVLEDRTRKPNLNYIICASYDIDF